MSTKALWSLVLVLSLALLAGLAYRLAPSLRASAVETLAATHCDPGTQACRAILPRGGQIELTISPEPIRALQTLALLVTVSGAETTALAVDFEGRDMAMGSNRSLLSGADGQFTGRAMLPVCVSGRMAWVATVHLDGKDGALAVPFHFTAEGVSR